MFASKDNGKFFIEEKNSMNRAFYIAERAIRAFANSSSDYCSNRLIYAVRKSPSMAPYRHH